jgi:hypothetical protein
MTSLGRLIYFDQPGTGASDPVTPDAMPTLEQWADSITAVLDDLGSREAVLIAIDGSVATDPCRVSRFLRRQALPPLPITKGLVFSTPSMTNTGVVSPA